MINRKLCIVMCCLGVGFAGVARAQSSGSDDQSKALEALRQAEKGQTPATNAPVAATPVPSPAVPDPDSAQALDALRQAEKNPPPAAETKPATPASAGVPVATQAAPANPEDDSRALEALRQAEKGGATAAVPGTAPASAPAAAPVAVTAAPANPQDDATALEALHQAEQAQEQSAADQAAAARARKEAELAAERQKKADEAAAAQAKKEADEKAREQAAAEQAAAKQKAADEAAARLEQAQAEKKAAELEKKQRAAEARQAKLAAVEPKPAAPMAASPAKEDSADTVAAEAALEEFERNGPAVPPDRQAELDALRRQKAQEEVAARVENLQKQIKSQPGSAAPAAAPAGPQTKEQKLADLLRRYNADEITPLEYHTERAKIIAEP